MKILRHIFLLAMITTPAAAEVIRVTPAIDDEIILHNPDMGWVLYENYPVDPNPGGSSTLVTLPDETFPDVAEVAVMFTWADVEREPGRYDFRDVDHAYDHWRARGKRIQLRISAESLMWWNNHRPPRGLGVPPHVLEKMPAERKQRRTEFQISYDVVDPRDATYLAALDRFLAAVAEHFSPEARPVTLVDLRGFGLWGEWHSGYRFASDKDRREALVAVIDHWAAAFRKHTLALCYSHDPDGPKDFYDGPVFGFDEKFTATYEKFLAYSAFDHARTKSNITWRRDGAGGAVYANQRKLCEEEFARLDRGPFMSEFVDGYAFSKRGGDAWLAKKIDDALSLHPNYINLLGWQAGDALAFIRGEEKLFRRGLREMGYRLVPVEMTYPASVAPGESFTVEMTWENRAVGRAMRDFQFRLVVGKEQIDAGAVETSRWIKGRSYTVTKEAKMPEVEPGAYPLHIGLIDPATGKPIALPLKDGAIGTITVEKGATDAHR